MKGLNLVSSDSPHILPSQQPKGYPNIGLWSRRAAPFVGSDPPPCLAVFSTSDADVCHPGCACTVFQTVQRPGVCSAVYGTLHYKKPLKSFDKTRT